MVGFLKADHISQTLDGICIIYVQDRVTLPLQVKFETKRAVNNPTHAKMSIELLHTIAYFLVLVYHSVHLMLLAT